MTVQSQTQTNVTRTSKTTTLSYLQFAEADDTFPYRLVGSYEYGRSLDNLGELANSSTKEEIEVYDKLIAMNPEYSFYSGAASELGVGVKLDSLDTSDKEMFDVKYLRQSLAWMMALARSELGATISMYGESKDPFGTAVAIGGVGFGSEELLSILVDDLAAHLKAAQRDLGYQAAVDPKKSIDESSLAYFRRTQLINDLLAKVVSSGDPEITVMAKPYAETSNRYTETMAKKIVSGTTPQLYSNTGSTRTTSTFEGTTGIRFQDRVNLLQCQRNLESRFGPPTEFTSALQ